MAVSRPRPEPERHAWTPRHTAWLTLAAVSLGAGAISYVHAHTVVAASGAPWAVAVIQPLLADLVILGGAANLLDAARAGPKLPRMSMAAAVIGAAVTLWMNVAAHDPRSVPFWLVNGWPPVAFGLALASLLGLIRRNRGGRPAGAHASAGQPPPLSLDAAIAAAGAHLSKRAIAEAFEVSRARFGGC